jgi:transcriptional regulator with XRE-family HTH domain
MKTPGERIRQARLDRGLSGHDLATAVGYAKQSAIANIENRSVTGGGRRIGAIARTLKVPLLWLLEGPDSDSIPYEKSLYQDDYPTDQITNVARDSGGNVVRPLPQGEHDEWTKEAIRIMRNLQPHERPGAIANLRTYVHHLGPPTHGHPVSMAENREKAA